MIKNCCQTCRYGNYCPFGGDVLYCMKGYKFANKMELCDLFNNFEVRDDIFDNKVRAKGFCCDEHTVINHDEYYTYNDWGLKNSNK